MNFRHLEQRFGDFRLNLIELQICLIPVLNGIHQIRLDIDDCNGKI